MQTLEFYSVKTAGDRVTWLFHIGFKVQSASSAMNPTNQRTIANLASVAKLSKKLIHHASKPKKANCAHTCSSVPIVKVNIRWTPQHIHSRRTTSIESSIKRSTLRFMKIELNQFIQLGIGTLNNDIQHSKDLLPEYLQKYINCQHYPQDSLLFWYHSYSRTFLVYHSLNF